MVTKTFARFSPDFIQARRTKLIRKLLVYDSYTLFWQKLRFEIFGRVRGGTPRSIFSDFDILAFNLRLDPPWRPNGPSERVLKPTMPSPTFDSEHICLYISPKQSFSKVIISDPGKHLKFRIFLKIGISPSEKKIKFFLFIFSPDHGILSTKKVVPKKKNFPPNRNYFCTFFSVHTSELGLT